MDDIKQFLTGMIVRWILKVGGSTLGTIGVTSGDLMEIVGGILAILIGLIISIFQQKKAVNTPAPTP